MSHTTIYHIIIFDYFFQIFDVFEIFICILYSNKGQKIYFKGRGKMSNELCLSFKKTKSDGFLGRKKMENQDKSKERQRE